MAGPYSGSSLMPNQLGKTVAETTHLVTRREPTEIPGKAAKKGGDVDFTRRGCVSPYPRTHPGLFAIKSIGWSSHRMQPRQASAIAIDTQLTQRLLPRAYSQAISTACLDGFVPCRGTSAAEVGARRNNISW